MSAAAIPSPVTSPQSELLERICARLEARGIRVPRQVARCRETLRRAPAAEHPRLLAALGELVPSLRDLLPAPWEGPLCPAYPRAPRELAARLALGERPVDVCRGLTAREAHEYLASGSRTSPAAWLVRDLRDLTVQIDHVPVARWLLACARDPARWAALATERVERGPDGTSIRGTYLARVDEIAPPDLVRGERTSVREAYAAASRRLYARWCRQAERQHDRLAPPPAWWRPIRCARPLLSAAELVAEGRTMGHCVGTYADVVRRRHSLILSIAVPSRAGLCRSTAQVDYRSGRVLQHRGQSNRDPHPLCVAALRVVLRRCGMEVTT
jgi:hypothetical protein